MMPADTASSSRRPAPGLVLGLLLVAGLGTSVNLHKSIWLDEAFTLERTRGSLEQVLHWARFTSLKPPLYFVLVSWWRKLDPSIEWTRAFSTLCMLGAVAYFHGLSRALRIGGSWLSLGLLAALTPHFLWAAAEARPYALTILFLASALYHAARLWFAESAHPWRDAVLLVLAGYGALLSFYYAGFVLAALFLAGLLARDVRRVVWPGVALAVLMIPWLGQISEHTSGQAGSYMVPVIPEGAGTLAGYATALAWLARQVPAIIFRGAPVVNRPIFLLAFGLLLAAILALRLRTGRPRWTRVETAFVLYAGLGFAMLAALRLANRTTVDMRHWIVVVPGLVLLPSLLAARVEPARRGRILLAGLAVYLSAGLVSFVRNERTRDWRSPAETVTQRERPGEPIILLGENPLPFQYYYRGSNSITRWPVNPYTSNRVDREWQVAEADRRHLENLLDRAEPPERSFWMVERVWPGSAPDVVERTLGERPEVLAVWAFHQTRLYHLRRTGGGNSPP